jgi:phage host-nuclease inhibitor protein Gam
MEQKIKVILGEYAFTIAALQEQVDQLQQKIKEYEDKPKRSKTD